MGQLAIPGNFISVLIFGFLNLRKSPNLRNSKSETSDELFNGN
jgi:hypothetical protein